MRISVRARPKLLGTQGFDPLLRVTVCNGEIYNAAELQKDLEARGHRMHTRVDTEIIPHLYEEHGPEMVHHLDGMFAFAVWDEASRTLMLGRDRAGEKPLFFWQGADDFVFASELRALLAHPRVPSAVDPVALRRYLLNGGFLMVDDFWGTTAWQLERA